MTYLGRTEDASTTTTLTVAPLSGGVQPTSMHNEHSTTEEDLVPRAAGLYVSRLRIAAPGAFDVSFGLSPAALLLPAHATTGQTWSWKALSTDGKTTATQTSKVTGTQTLAVGGKKVSTVVVQTHLVLEGAATYTADVTTWAAPSYSLVVRQRTKGHGQSSFGAFSNELTDALRSLRPA